MPSQGRAGSRGSPSGQRRRSDRLASRAGRSARSGLRSRRGGTVGPAVTGQLGPVSSDGADLSLLGGRPELFFLIQRHFGETRLLLDSPEAPFELGVGFTQRRFRLDVKMACEVHDREEQVAELIQLAV